MYYLFYYQVVLETYLSFQFILNNPSKPVISAATYDNLLENKKTIIKENQGKSGVYMFSNQKNGGFAQKYIK
jgi:hypothetical protein